MQVYFRPYNLKALRKANRLSSLGTRHGVHLKIKQRFTEHFADYFPHTELGDRPVEQYLPEFKFQAYEYDQKVFHFLLNEEKLRKKKITPFLNHELWDGITPPTAPVVKYKLMDKEDRRFTRLSSVLRLDANGLFEKHELLDFLKDVPSSKIEYIEDPLQSSDWSQLGVKTARDFIAGGPYDYLIHKPNCRFLREKNASVIFSSYMGSDLGLWHAYCELLELGDLKSYHGLLTPNLYEEQRLRFTDSSVLEMYKNLSSGDWKFLCSI
jgi:hypothetical protein